MSERVKFEEDMLERMTNHLTRLGYKIKDKIAYCVDAAYSPENYSRVYDPLYPEALSYPDLTPLLSEAGEVSRMLEHGLYEDYYDKYVEDCIPDYEVD